MRRHLFDDILRKLLLIVTYLKWPNLSLGGSGSRCIILFLALDGSLMGLLRSRLCMIYYWLNSLSLLVQLTRLLHYYQL